ncbi:unnamed protein product [Amoebophrya sp. A120]|nr:unnamed protein product [Amoebophrya sp. A120]|eukprot:GSA120T00002649001.1
MTSIFKPGVALNPNEKQMWLFLWERFVSSYEHDKDVHNIPAEVQRKILLLTTSCVLVRVAEGFEIFSYRAVMNEDAAVKEELEKPERGFMVLDAKVETAMSSQFRSQWAKLLGITNPSVRFRKELHEDFVFCDADAPDLQRLRDFVSGRGVESGQVRLPFVDALLGPETGLFPQMDDAARDETAKKVRSFFQNLEVRTVGNLQKKLLDARAPDGEPVCVYPVKTYFHLHEESLIDGNTRQPVAVLYLEKSLDASSFSCTWQIAGDLTGAIERVAGTQTNQGARWFVLTVLEGYKRDLQELVSTPSLMRQEQRVGVKVQPHLVELQGSPTLLFREGEHVVRYDANRDEYFSATIVAAQPHPNYGDDDPWRVLNATYLVLVDVNRAQQRSEEFLSHHDLYKYYDNTRGQRVNEFFSSSTVLALPLVNAPNAAGVTPLQSGNLSPSVQNLRKQLADHEHIVSAADYKKLLRRLIVHWHPDKLSVPEPLATEGTKFLTQVYERFSEDESYRYTSDELQAEVDQQRNQYAFHPRPRAATGGTAGTSQEYQEWGRAARQHRREQQAASSALRPPRDGQAGSPGVIQDVEDDASDEEQAVVLGDDSAAAAQAEAAEYVALGLELRGYIDADLAGNRFDSACYYAFSAVHKLLLGKARQAGYQKHPAKGSSANFSARGLSLLYKSLLQDNVAVHDEELEKKIKDVQGLFMKTQKPAARAKLTLEYATRMRDYVNEIFEYFGN